MRRRNNNFAGIAVIGLLLLISPLARSVFGVGFRIGFVVLFALLLAAIVLLILNLVRPNRKKDEPKTDGTQGGQRTANPNKTVYTSSANGQSTVYASKTVNPYSSHQTSRPPQPEPAPEPEPAPKKAEPKSTGNKELDLVLKQGRGYMTKLEELNERIPDFKVSARIKQIIILTEKIFDYIETHPEDIHQTRQMLSYYLPTTVKLLDRYIELQNQGIRVGNIDEGMQKVEALLDKLAVAFQQQLDGLFEDDLVDITADIQVMEQMFASEGLTGTKDF